MAQTFKNNSTYELKGSRYHGTAGRPLDLAASASPGQVPVTAAVENFGLKAPQPSYEYDLDHENPSDHKRLFIAETWGIGVDAVAGFGEMRHDPEARAAFVAEWDEEPNLDYFEDFVHQLMYNQDRHSNSELAAEAAQELMDVPDVEDDREVAPYDIPDWLMAKIRANPRAVAELLQSVRPPQEQR